MKDSFSTFHPIINFMYFVVVLGVSMFVNHPVILVTSLVTGIVYSMVLLGVKQSLKFNLLYMLPMLFITALINPAFNHSGITILFYLENGNPITLESIVYGVVMSVMLITAIVWFSCYNQVMTSDKFIYLFGRVIPALSLILSMVLRFVPKFKAQLKVIANGQKCIGRDISNGNIFERAKHGITILSILITWALENAIETADSMKARGYGLKGRTAFSIFRFDSRDRIMALMMLLMFGIFIVGCVGGAVFVQYNPMIKIAGINPVTPMSLLSFLTFGAFCLIPIVTDIVDYFTWKTLAAQVPERQEAAPTEKQSVAVF